MGAPKKKDIDEQYEESEATTVVIDINQFKKELGATSETANESVDIEFSVHGSNAHPESNEQASEEVIEKPKNTSSELSLDNFDESLDDLDSLGLSEEPTRHVVLFDYKSTALSKLHNQHSQEGYEFYIVNDLKELNSLIKDHDELTVIFYYNQAPKVINNLMKQLNKKFKHINTFIIAKNLSEAKAKAHQKTSSGANYYLSLPKSFGDVVKKLDHI